MLFQNMRYRVKAFRCNTETARKYLLLFSIAANFAFANFAESAGKKTGKLRVISLSPSLTETVFHLGRGDWLAGRSSACNYPEEAKKVEIAGDFGRPSIEKLVSLKPDIVIASAMAEPALKTTLQQLNIRFYLLPDKSFDEYFATVKKLGELLDCRKRAADEIKRVKTGLAKFAEDNKKLQENRPKIYLEIWDRPYMTIGKKSFINDMIEYAGGKNIASDREEGYFNCSEEWIIKSDPEIIICPGMKDRRTTDVMKRNGWQKISAVKNNRIYAELNSDLLYRLGPRALDGIKILRKIIIGNVPGTAAGKQKGKR